MVGFRTPYDPETGEPLNPEEQDAYARLAAAQAYGFQVPGGDYFPTPAPPEQPSEQRPSDIAGGLGRAAAGLTSTAFPEASPIVQEIGRPINYIPFGRAGSTLGRAALNVGQAVAGRVAQEAAQPLVEKLPESIRPVADLGVNLAAQVATGIGGGRALRAGREAAETTAVRAAEGPAETSARGILRAAPDGAPGAVVRATDVPVRRAIAGAADDEAAVIGKMFEDAVMLSQH